MLSHSRVWLCNLTDCSPPGSSVHGILQARILEWVAMPSSRGSSQLRDPICVSCISYIGRWGFFFTTSTTCIFLSSLSLLEDSTKTFSFWKIKITKWNVIYICVTYRYLKASNRHLPKHIQKRINIYWKDICKTTEMKGRYKYTDLKWSRTPWSSPHQPCPQSVFCLWKKFSQRISEKM